MRPISEALIGAPGLDAPTRAWLWASKGEQQWRAGQPQAAEASLRQALRLNDEPHTRVQLADLLAEQGGRLPEALALLQKAVRARPNVGAIVDSLGWAYYRMGDIPKAIEQLERAAELDAADPAVNDHLGDAYLSAGRKLEAVYQWQRVLTLSPDNKLRNQVQTKITQHQGEVIASAAPQAPVTP